MLLHVDGLGIHLAGKPVVRDLGFQLDAGELLVVLGPNGAGKSTLLKGLAGEHKIADGQVSFAGCTLQHWSKREIAKRRAVMPQRVEVNFPLTVEEIVRLGRPVEPLSQSMPVVSELMDLLDVAHLRYRLAPGLSGGEQQRVQLARVLAQVWDAQGPVLLLLDECTSALDPAHQQQVFSLLRRLAKQRGFAVLAVAHDLNLAARFADRLLLLHHGQCYISGKPFEVLSETVLAAVYGLSARIIKLEEGYPLVVPRDDGPEAVYASPSLSPSPSNTAPVNPSCRQAS
ncbi:heme ABC transporter ATP-binding protein [Marinobacter salexigens]|uniref:Heme ABC transporter ATP-binding protein n=1 Tax=Marinobacter salexigens TaxID=1925763 RepID=A0ABS6A6M0_9GAMM|nr:heme ABC transporter ATP-binding protein [Marinobacter salexigens]MBU2873748.1 heme ABC transporter ATP-binding protein [Marinobacter salexigens]